MNIVNMFQLRLLDHSTSFVIISTTLQYQLSPLLTSVLSGLSWIMPVQCSIFTPIPMSIFWNQYNIGLPVGLPIGGGIHYRIAGVNLLVTVCKSYTGLPSSSATSISPFAMYMIVCTTETLYLFTIIFSYSKPQLDLILYRSGQLYLLLICITSLFL